VRTSIPTTKNRNLFSEIGRFPSRIPRAEIMTRTVTETDMICVRDLQTASLFDQGKLLLANAENGP
jgi:hypothetical protein